MNSYLEKHSFCNRLISASVSADIFMIVVIPCHDEPDLLATFQSLYNCDSTTSAVEVIAVINSGDQDNAAVLERNIKTLYDATQWIKNHSSEKRIFRLIHVKDLPHKHAGVGLARKIGMDEAVRRFDDIHNPKGVIVCLDADCTVEKNYLRELENHFMIDENSSGCSVYFEHPIEGKEFEEEIYQGIINYELFLRYYCRGLAFANFPYSFQTIGSCMAVRSSIYQKQGGMNRRKAGEDFYFLHKVFPLGGFNELNSTKVIPSPRISHRVPFGTGSAMNKILNAQSASYPAYNIQCFIDLKEFFQLVPSFHAQMKTENIPESLQSFLKDKGFIKKINEAKEHSGSKKMFVKRFFNWFDGFMVLKYMHFARDNYYPPMEIGEAAKELMVRYGIGIKGNTSKKELLLKYREWDRSAVNLTSKAGTSSSSH